MLTAEENELACRVGPGTPMGELMRRHWLPGVMSSELVADGEPVRLLLLGEKLVAFRDTKGKVGIMDHECPHRLASLFYGRNEEGGIRCIYHGWKFDVEGNCLDMANVPPHQDFKDNVKAKAYQVAERGGLVWVYMGPGKAPGLPAIPANLLPEDEVAFHCAMRECNWLQALEGGIDTSHANFLHGGMNGVLGLNKKPKESPDDPAYYNTTTYGWTEYTFEFEGSETPWGSMFGGYRPVDEKRDYWRLAQFIFPFWTIPPTASIDRHFSLNAWVPMDDGHTMVFRLGRKGGLRAGSAGPEQLPNTTDWLGRWRLAQNEGNDYWIDRKLQSSKQSYSGIPGGAIPEDQAVTEAMGPILNRTKEHLAPTDRMVMVTRRCLIDAAIRLRDTGEVPLTVSRPEIYHDIAAGYFLAPKGKSLDEIYAVQQAAYIANANKLPVAAE